MKKYLLLILLFFITGCSSYVELNDLAIVNAIGIEKENNQYHLYLSYVEKLDQDTMQPETKVIEIEGSNMMEIIEDLSLTLSKKIYMSHLDLLIINDTIKNQELENIINYFLNNNETREDFLVISTNDIKKVLEASKFQEINELINNNIRESSKSIYTTMYDVITNYYQKETIYFPHLNYEETIKIKGLKAFKNNTYQEINEEDVIYINYLLNKIETYKYNKECKKNNYLYLNILGANVTSLKDELIITNELKVITNDCNLNHDEINKLFNTDLKTNLKKLTTKKITIKNTIRGLYER